MQSIDPTTLAVVDTVVNILTMGGIVGIAFAAGGARKAIQVLERDMSTMQGSVKDEIRTLDAKIDSLRAAIGTRREDDPIR